LREDCGHLVAFQSFNTNLQYESAPRTAKSHVKRSAFDESRHQA
jgi:hypothetical protein